VFLAMERVEGKDLGSSLARAGAKLPPLLAAFVAAECCQALDYAHLRKSPDGAPLGIVHRDVTPRNVLLSWSGEVKLTDFGIAALAGDRTGRLIGTPAYMAPEQARGETLDVRADVYAIGLVLREALTGVRPRAGADREAILAAARKGELGAWPDGAPAALVAIADRATATARDDRYPDARSMLEELDAFIVGERAAAKAESPARQLAAWLATLWGDERERMDEADDAAIDASHLLSYLDDGALDAVGTGTERSLLATEAESVEFKKVDLSLPPKPQAKTRAKTEAKSGAKTEPPRNRARLVAGIAIVGAAAIGLAAYVATREPEPATKTAARDPKTAVAEPTFVATTGDVNTRDPKAGTNTGDAKTGDPRATANAGDVKTGDPTNPGDVKTGDPKAGSTAGDVKTGDPKTAANTGDVKTGDPKAATNPGDVKTGDPKAGTTATHVKAGDPKAAANPGDVKTGDPKATVRDPKSGSRTVDPKTVDPKTGDPTSNAVPAVTHRVTINSTPWSNFTIDDDPTQHETPETVMLAPGPHRIQFRNPALHLERKTTLDVPDRDTTHVEKLEP
jgi:hypothetical protein